MIAPPSSKLIEAVGSLNQLSLFEAIHQNPQSINDLSSFLSNPTLADTLKLSAASCINASVKYLLTAKYDAHLLMDMMKRILLDANIENIHKWVLVKSIKFLVQAECQNISIETNNELLFWITLCKECLQNQQIRMSGVLIADAIVEADVCEASFIYLIKGIFELMVEASLKDFERLSLNYLKNLGSVLNEIVKRLERSIQNYNSEVAVQLMVDILRMQRIYELFNRVYLIGSQDMLVIDISPDCERINLIKQTFAQCNHRVVQYNRLAPEGSFNSSLSLAAATIAPLFIYSLKRAVQSQFIKKYSCETLIIYMLRILKHTLMKDCFGTSNYARELTENVVLPLLRTTQEDFRAMEDDPSSFFEQQEDICSNNKYETLRAASANLLENCIDTSKEVYPYVYALCEASILGGQSLISKADALLILAITSYYTIRNSTAPLENLLSNLDIFKPLSLFEKGRWYNLLSYFVEQINQRTLKEYSLLASICTKCDYYNLRCLDFLYNCVSKIIFDKLSRSEDTEGGNLDVEGEQATEWEIEWGIESDSKFLQNIINNLLEYIPTVKFEMFWSTLDEILFLDSQIYNESTYVRIVTQLYLRVRSDMDKSLGDTQAIFNCLHLVKRIAGLCQSYPLLKQTISQIFPLLNSPQDINFEQQIISILNVFLEQTADISSYLQYLRPLHAVFVNNSYIYQSIFSSLNLFISKYSSDTFDEHIALLYQFCIQGFSPRSEKWFEEDMGDALLLFQMFLYKYKELIHADILVQIAELINEFKPKIAITETKHRLINTQVLMLQITPSLTQEIQACYKQMNEYNIRVLLVGLTNVLLHVVAERASIFELIIKVVSFLLQQNIKNISNGSQEKAIEKSRNKENEYYSQNVEKVKFMWKTGFKPFDHVRGILAIIQSEGEQTLSRLVGSLSLETQLKLKQLYPMLWLGGSFRKVVSVKRVKQHPDPYDMKQISSELRRITTAEEEMGSYKKLKRS